MYGTAGNKSRVKSNIDGVINQGLALCIGEFGWYHSDGDVDEAQILSYCQEKNVGWLAWSWYGNGNPVQYLDLVDDASAAPGLSVQTASGKSCEWGKKIVDAWEKESKKAIFGKCPASEFNDVTSYDDKTIIYYIQSENKLHVKTKKDGILQIISLNGIVVDRIKISKVENEIMLDKLPKGIFIAYFEGLAIKIVR